MLISTSSSRLAYIIFGVLMMVVCCLVHQRVVDARWNITSKVSMMNKKATVLGLDFDYAMMDLPLDRDLYIYKTVPCSNFTRPLPPANDCTCDYANKSNCGNTVSGHPSCPPCNTAPFLCNMSWVAITPNQPLLLHNLSLGVYQIRYKANAPINEGLVLNGRIVNCDLRLRLAVYLSCGPTACNRRISYNGIMTLCPSDNTARETFTTNNTYIFQVALYAPANQPMNAFPPQTVEFLLHSADVPPLASGGIAGQCVNLTTQHSCINDGMLFNTTNSSSNYYTFIVDRPVTLTLRCNIFSGKSTYAFISDSEPSPSITKNKWRFGSPHDQYFQPDFFGVINVGPCENGTSKVLYFNIENQSNLCTVTTHAAKWLYPAYPSDGAEVAMLNNLAARLIYPDGTFEGMDEYAFAPTVYMGPYWNVYPQQSPNPFWPVPPSIFLDDYIIQLYSTDDLQTIVPHDYVAKCEDST